MSTITTVNQDIHTHYHHHDRIDLMWLYLPKAQNKTQEGDGCFQGNFNLRVYEISGNTSGLNDRLRISFFFRSCSFTFVVF